MLVNQDNLSLKIQLSVSDDTIVLDSFEATEGISIPFEVIALFHSTSPDLSFSDLVGSPVKIWASLSQLVGSSDMPDSQKIRYFCGKIGKIEQLRVDGDLNGSCSAHYHAYIYPDFWFLKFSKNYRIFQNISVVDIIQAVLGESGVNDIELQSQTAGQAEREYCVQYGESHFDFISRLMEEEGIFYYFTHTESGHTMVLSDSNDNMLSIPQDKLPFIHSTPEKFPLNAMISMNIQEQVVVKKFKTADFCYQTPLVKLKGNIDGVGVGRDFYQYPGLFQNNGDGEKVSDVWIGSLDWSKQMVEGNCTCMHLSGGVTFNVTDHPRNDANKTYAVYKVKHTFTQQPLSEYDSSLIIYQNNFAAFDKDVKFRPLKITPKIRIHGTQTAFVCGIGEVFSDDLGRVKVHFHWDLDGTSDENSSCWVRVSQTWSGPGWGALVTPRIGMEVVVNFIDGDPDRPLVTGCVYNGNFNPPYSSGTSPNYATFKTQTIEAGGFNELRFSDQAGAEEIYTHAQKDVVTVIEDNRTEDINAGNDKLTIHTISKYITLLGSGTEFTTHIVEGDKNFNIDTGNFNTTITTGDQNTTITQGNKNITLKQGDYNTTLNQGNKNLTIDLGDLVTLLSSGNATVTLSSGNITVEVNGNIDVNVTGDITVNALGSIAVAALKGVSIDTPKSVSVNAGKDVTTEAGKNITDTAGENIEESAGKIISMSGGQSITREAGQTIADNAGQAITIAAGMKVDVSGGMTADFSGGLTCSVSGGLKLNTEGGLIAEHSGGLIAKYEGGLQATFEGGCMNIVKGPMVKIGP